MTSLKMKSLTSFCKLLAFFLLVVPNVITLDKYWTVSTIQYINKAGTQIQYDNKIIITPGKFYPFFIAINSTEDNDMPLYETDFKIAIYDNETEQLNYTHDYKVPSNIPLAINAKRERLRQVYIGVSCNPNKYTKKIKLIPTNEKMKDYFKSEVITIEIQDIIYEYLYYKPTDLQIPENGLGFFLSNLTHYEMLNVDEVGIQGGVINNDNSEKVFLKVLTVRIPSFSGLPLDRDYLPKIEYQNQGDSGIHDVILGGENTDKYYCFRPAEIDESSKSYFTIISNKTMNISVPESKKLSISQVYDSSGDKKPGCLYLKFSNYVEKTLLKCAVYADILEAPSPDEISDQTKKNEYDSSLLRFFTYYFNSDNNGKELTFKIEELNRFYKYKCKCYLLNNKYKDNNDAKKEIKSTKPYETPSFLLEKVLPVNTSCLNLFLTDLGSLTVDILNKKLENFAIGFFTNKYKTNSLNGCLNYQIRPNPENYFNLKDNEKLISLCVHSSPTCITSAKNFDSYFEDFKNALNSKENIKRNLGVNVGFSRSSKEKDEYPLKNEYKLKMKYNRRINNEIYYNIEQSFGVPLKCYHNIGAIVQSNFRNVTESFIIKDKEAQVEKFILLPVSTYDKKRYEIHLKCFFIPGEDDYVVQSMINGEINLDNTDYDSLCNNDYSIFLEKYCFEEYSTKYQKFDETLKLQDSNQDGSEITKSISILEDKNLTEFLAKTEDYKILHIQQSIRYLYHDETESAKINFLVVGQKLAEYISRINCWKTFFNTCLDVKTSNLEYIWNGVKEMFGHNYINNIIKNYEKNKSKNAEQSEKGTNSFINADEIYSVLKIIYFIFNSPESFNFQFFDSVNDYFRMFIKNLDVLDQIIIESYDKLEGKNNIFKIHTLLTYCLANALKVKPYLEIYSNKEEEFVKRKYKPLNASLNNSFYYDTSIRNLVSELNGTFINKLVKDRINITNSQLILRYEDIENIAQNLLIIKNFENFELDHGNSRDGSNNKNELEIALPKKFISSMKMDNFSGLYVEVFTNYPLFIMEATIDSSKIKDKKTIDNGNEFKNFISPIVVNIKLAADSYQRNQINSIKNSDKYYIKFKRPNKDFKYCYRIFGDKFNAENVTTELDSDYVICHPNTFGMFTIGKEEVEGIKLYKRYNIVLIIILCCSFIAFGLFLFLCIYMKIIKRGKPIESDMIKSYREKFSNNMRESKKNMLKQQEKIKDKQKSYIEMMNMGNSKLI